MRALAILLCLCLLPCTCLAHIPSDKAGHFVIGFALSAVVGGEQGMWAGVGAGLAKEGMDYMDRQHHSVEFWDAVATGLGSYLAYRLFPKAVKKQPTMKIELYDGSKI